MTASATSVPHLDRLIHEPARLAILSALSSVDQADFSYLLVALGLSRGNLSSHMTRLAEVGYIKVRKRFIGNVPNTSYSLTDKGRQALDGYWRELDALRPEVPEAAASASAPSARTMARAVVPDEQSSGRNPQDWRPGRRYTAQPD